MNWFTQKWLSSILLILALALIVPLVFFSSFQLKRLDNANSWVTHTHQVIDGAENMLTYLADAESKQRGFLLTNDLDYLADFNSTIEAVNYQFKSIKTLTRDNPVQQKHLNVLEPLLKSRISLLVEIAKLRQTQSHEVTMRKFSYGKSLRLTEQIKQKLKEFIAEETTLLKERNSAAINHVRKINDLIMAGGCVSILLLLLSFMILHRHLKFRFLAEQSNRDLQTLFNSIISGTTDCIVALNLEYRFVTFNDAYAKEYLKVFGKKISIGMNAYGALNQLPEEQANALSFWKKALAGERFTVTREIGNAAIERKIYEMTYSPLINNEGKCVGLSYIFRDITPQIKEKQKLQESEERFRTAFDYSATGMALISLTGKWLKVNQTLCNIVDYTQNELLQIDSQSITYSDDLETELYNLEQLIIGNLPSCQYEKRYIKKSGGTVWALVTVSLVRDSKEKPLYLISQIQDIDGKKKAEENLKHIAYHDSLTGLNNRSLLEHDAKLILSSAKRYHYKIAFLFLDLDYFKEINDNYGHDIGDELLRQVANNLKQCTRATDIVARLGGDEFVIILTDLASSQEVTRVAEKILAHFNVPTIVYEHSLRITSSIGVSVYPEDGDDYTTLLKNADIALYKAKKAGRNNYQFFESDIESNVK